MAVIKDSTAAVFIKDERHTRSYDRAAEVIEFLSLHRGDPIPVAEVAEKTGSYYEEVLHIVTTLEVIGAVHRYQRQGSPREGARVAYAWVKRPTRSQNRSARRGFQKEDKANPAVAA